MAEWASGNDYVTRVAHIRDGAGLNAGYRLFAGETVDDDGVIDEIFGGGSQDWFFNFGAANEKFSSKDKKANELVN